MKINLDDSLHSYKGFVKENKELVEVLNALRRQIRFFLLFDENADDYIIQALYDSCEDSKDIAEVLGKTEFEINCRKAELDSDLSDSKGV